MGRDARRGMTLCTLIGIGVISPSPASFTPPARPLSSWTREVQDDAQRVSRQEEVLSAVHAQRVQDVRSLIEEWAQTENHGVADFLKNAAERAASLMTATWDAFSASCPEGIWNGGAVQGGQTRTAHLSQNCFAYHRSLLNAAAEIERATASALARACYTHGESVAASWQAHGEAKAAGFQAQEGGAMPPALQRKNAAVARAESDLAGAKKLHQALGRYSLFLRDLAALSIEAPAAYASYMCFSLNQSQGAAPLENTFSQRLDILE